MLLKDLLITVYDTAIQIYDPFEEIIFDWNNKNPASLVDYFDFPVQKITTEKAEYNIPVIVIYL